VLTGAAAMESVFIDFQHDGTGVVGLFSAQLCVMVEQPSFHRARTQLQLLDNLLIAHPIGAILENGIVEQLLSPLPFHLLKVIAALGKSFAAASTLIPFNSHF